MARVGITYNDPEKLPPYEAAARYAGLSPVPLLAPGPPSLEGLDALIISGGTDVNPALYGQQPHPKLLAPNDARDEMELRLLREALDRDLPVLAICRGMQLFNVALGGDLIQDMDGHRVVGVPDVHPVELAAGSKLAAACGVQSFTVNSRHHQAIDRTPPQVAVCARAADGTIEALELPGHRFAIAVQWHPEDRVPSHEPDTRLFEALAAVIG